jgi:hypothetical protein
MKKLTLFLIPIAILLACEPILPGPGGGGGITNPENRVKGSLIRKVEIKSPLDVSYRTVFIEYNADSVITKLNSSIGSYNVKYPSNTNIRLNNDHLINKNGIKINFISVNRQEWALETFRDTLYFNYVSGNLFDMVASSQYGSGLSAYDFQFDGNNLIGYHTFRKYEYTYSFLSEDIQKVNVNVINNILFQRNEFGPTFTVWAMSLLPVSYSGKLATQLITSAKRIHSSQPEIYEKYNYEKDSEGRIIRLNVLDGSNDILKEYYIFEY